MAYDEAVVFTKTGQYGCGPEYEDDVYTIEEFKSLCERKLFIDYDGYGHPVKNKLCDPRIFIRPSKLEEIPEDATHIVWYNK